MDKRLVALRADITTRAVDAIVNAADEAVLGGAIRCRAGLVPCLETRRFA